MDLLQLHLLLLVNSLCCTTNGLFFRTKVCYRGVGCFSNKKPFDNTMGELPDSPTVINVRTFLWTKQNAVEAQEIYGSDLKSISHLNFNASRPTIILIHGFMSSKNAPVVANLSVALLNRGDYNVIGVDWSTGSRKLYPKAAANTRVVGTIVAKLVSILHTNFGLKLGTLHVIGHSLGAHIAGHVGRLIPGINRITGLDPAGPLFAKYDAIVRLDPTDALFVDVIHTDAAPLIHAGFGTMTPLGHQDFYPNGGLDMPGCTSPIRTSVEMIITGRMSGAFKAISCGHDRAIWYFIESVSNTQCHFTAFACQSWQNYLEAKCTTCTNNKCSEMGIDAAHFISRGTFFLRTSAQSTYCRNEDCDASVRKTNICSL